MRLIVHVNDRSFDVAVGEADQIFKWVAVVAAHRYSVAQGHDQEKFQPYLIVREAPDTGEYISTCDPYVRISNVLREDEVLSCISLDQLFLRILIEVTCTVAKLLLIEMTWNILLNN